MIRSFIRTFRFIKKALGILTVIAVILLFPYAASEKDGTFWLLLPPKGERAAYHTNLLRIIIDVLSGKD